MANSVDSNQTLQEIDIIMFDRYVTSLFLSGNEETKSVELG